MARPNSTELYDTLNPAPGDEPFEPHITLGLFSHAVEAEQVARIVERQHLPIHGRVEELSLLKRDRRRARHAADRAARRMLAHGFLGRLAVLVLAGCVIGLPLRPSRPLGRGALMIWDIAAGGKPTWWQRSPTGRTNTRRTGPTARATSTARLTRCAPPWCWCRARRCWAATSRACRRWPGPSPARASSCWCRNCRRCAGSRCRSDDADRVASAMRQLRQWQPSKPLRRRRGVLCGGTGGDRRPAGRAAVHRRHRRLPRCGGGDPLRHHRRVPPDRRSAPAHASPPIAMAAGPSCSPMPAGWRIRTTRSRCRPSRTMRFRDPDADVSAIADRLGPNGKAVLALVENRDPDAVTQLVSALPGRVRREIDGLNLALYDLSKLRCHTDPGARPRRSAGALQRKPGTGRSGVERPRLAVPGRRSRPCRFQRRHHRQRLDDVARRRNPARRARSRLGARRLNARAVAAAAGGRCPAGRRCRSVPAFRGSRAVPGASARAN